MNDQELFETVARHLFAQGKQASSLDQEEYDNAVQYSSEPPSKDDFTTCRYRTPEGLKCAIGCLIPDEMYKPAMDGVGGIYGLIAEFPEIAELLDIKTAYDRMSLLGALQTVHDLDYSWGNTDTMRNELLYIADRFHLNPEIVSTLKFQDR